MSFKKRIISAIMSVAMLASIVSTAVFAVNEPTIRVSSQTIEEGTQTVDVTVSLENNPGIITMLLNVNYNHSAFTLTNVADAGVLGTATHSDDYSLALYQLYWNNGTATSNYTANGKIVTLTFAVSPDAKLGEYDVSVSYDNVNSDDIFNKAFEPVEFEIVNGSVKITEPQKQDMQNVRFTSQTFTYDGTEKSIAVTGAPNGATIKYYIGEDEYTAIRERAAGEYNVRALVTCPGYNDKELLATLTINKKPVTVTGLAATSRAYNGSSKVQITGGTLSGVIAVDDVKAAMPSEGTVADINAGNYKNVKFDAIQLTGKDAGNYVLSAQPQVYVNITKATVTVVAKSHQIVKGAELPELTYTYDGLIGSDKLEGKLSTNANSSRVGIYSIQQGSLSAGNNYNIEFTPGTIEVVDKTPQAIIFDGISEKVYGDEPFTVDVEPDKTSNLTNFTFVSSNTDVAEIDLKTGEVTIKKAGTTTITVKEAGNEEYAPFEKSQTLTVKKVDITVNAKSASKRVESADPDKFDYTYEGNLVGDDEFTGALTRQQGEKVGTYDILQGTLAINENYNIIFNKAVFEIIDKISQNVTVDEISEKTYGDTPFYLPINVDIDSGISLNDFTVISSNEDVATAELGTTGYSIKINGAGETEITVSNNGNADYKAFESKVTLKVNKKELTITSITLATKSAQLVGIINNDEAMLDFDKLTQISIISEEKIKYIVSAFMLTGEKANNYFVKNEKITATDEETLAPASAEDVKLPEDITGVVLNASVAGETAYVTVLTDSRTPEEKTENPLEMEVTKKSAVLSPSVIDNVPGGFQFPDAKVKFEGLTGLTGNVSLAAKKDNIGLNEQQQAAKDTLPADTQLMQFSLNDATSGTPLFTDGGSVTGSAVVSFYYPSYASGNIKMDCLKDDGTTEPVSSVTINASTKEVTATLSHFSEYAVYTEPIVHHSSGGSVTLSYTVKFETNGGSKIDSVKVNAKEALTAPKAPTKEGFVFKGWYTDKALENEYNFDEKVTKSMTLYAAWEEGNQDDDNQDDGTKVALFDDVKETDWFYPYVKAMSESGLMQGVSATEFGPSIKVTRAMFVTVLYRLDGEPAFMNDNVFSDVEGGSYYEKATIWANGKGIVFGKTDKTFEPNTAITREEIATLIARYAKYKEINIDETVNDADTLSHNDIFEVSDWANEAVNYCITSGIILGDDNGNLNPKKDATRAEVATMLVKFADLLGLNN